MKAFCSNMSFILFVSLSLVLVSVPADLRAMPTESTAALQEGGEKEAMINKILSALDHPSAAAHLKLMGIDRAGLKEELNQLDEIQLAQIAERADQVKAAGDGVGLAIGILLVVLLVVLIFYFLGHHHGH